MYSSIAPIRFAHEATAILKRKDGQMKRQRSNQFIRIFASCLTLLALGAVPAHAAWPGGDGKIAFQTNRDGNYEIYTMNADGSGQTRITNNTAADNFPVWSPDGTKIAFQSHRDGNWEIYTMNPDGSGQTNFTVNPSYDELPDWRPELHDLAWDSDRN